MLRCLMCCAVAALAFAESSAYAQIKAAVEDSVVRFGDAQVTRYRVGASITAKRGAVRDVLATVAVPLTCPEQKVELVDEDISDFVRSYAYRMLNDGGAQQMLIRVPQLPDRAEAHAILTFEVRTRIILPPTETAELVIPQKLPRKLKRYLGKSPFIETRHSKLKKLSRKIFAKFAPTGEPASAGGDQQPPTETSTPTDWQRVEAIYYDHVLDTIQYKEQDDKSALATLKDGHGDCQNISALFVALCRTNKIPARIVWVHEHNYPEFCLADAEGKLHWFPCESSGTRAFGEMPLARVIMQKGDNFKVPERKKALRYASDYLIAVPAHAGVGKPSHKFIREQL